MSGQRLQCATCNEPNRKTKLKRPARAQEANRHVKMQEEKKTTPKNAVKIAVFNGRLFYVVLGRNWCVSVGLWAFATKPIVISRPTLRSIALGWARANQKKKSSELLQNRLFLSYVYHFERSKWTLIGSVRHVRVCLHSKWQNQTECVRV